MTLGPLLGIDVSRSTLLIAALTGTSIGLDDARHEIIGAEQLADLVTGTTSRLDDIVDEFDALAAAVSEAASALTSFRPPPIRRFRHQPTAGRTNAGSSFLATEPGGGHPLIDLDRSAAERAVGTRAHPLTAAADLRATEHRARTRSRVAELRRTLWTHATDRSGRLDAFTSRGRRELSAGTSRREQWLSATRLSEADHAHASTWGTSLGFAPDDGVLVLGAYRTLDDRGLNTPILENRSNLLLGDQTPSIIIETEARRIFADLALAAVEHGWTREQLAVAHDAAIQRLAHREAPLGWRNSDETTSQLGVAFSMLVGKHRLGDPLPTLSDDELAFAVQAGAGSIDGVGFQAQLVDITDALAQPTDGGLARGLRGLATVVGGAQILGAAIDGDDDELRDLTADLAIGTLIAHAARWIAPRIIAGPIAGLAVLLLALTDTPPPTPDGGPPSTSQAPRLGYVDEYGVAISNINGNAAGVPDPIAHGH